MAFAYAPPPSQRDHQTGASAYRSTTPAPQSKPVIHATRLVAQDAPLVAFGPGMRIPAAGPARSTHTTPSASAYVAADPKVSVRGSIALSSEAVARAQGNRPELRKRLPHQTSRQAHRHQGEVGAAHGQPIVRRRCTARQSRNADFTARAWRSPPSQLQSEPPSSGSGPSASQGSLLSLAFPRPRPPGARSLLHALAENSLALAAMEGVVEAPRPHSSRLDQIVDRRIVIAVLPKRSH